MEEKQNTKEKILQKSGNAVENVGKVSKATGTATSAVGKTTRVAGTAGKYGGKAVNYAGKGISSAGKGVMKAGQGLNSSGYGAILGVSLTVLGAGLTAAGKTTEVITTQTKLALEGLSKEQVENTIIAYEPIWAIGTGKTATSEDANNSIKEIRNQIANACAFTTFNISCTLI